jgi:Ca-activated chloride channel family protein
VQCPLTTDYAAVKLFLDAVEVGQVPTQGTNLEAAIRTARKLLADAQRGVPRGQVLVLLSDGEGHEGDPVAEAERARKDGVVIYTVGIGSSTGEPIPLLDEDGKVRGYRKDRTGETVMTRLQEGILRQVAEAAGGAYIHSVGGGVGIDEVHRELARLQKAEFESRLFVQFDEKFQWLLWPALALLAAATLLGERRRVREVRP